MYWRWLAMKQRCFNEKNIHYKNYGGRGIKVCERWLTFDNFLQDMGFPEEDLSIERIDNDKDYCPENCIWATRNEQAKNRRNVKLIEFDNKKLTLKELCNSLNLNYYTIKTRIQKGMQLTEALFCGKYPNNNIYGHNENGSFMKKVIS